MPPHEHHHLPPHALPIRNENKVKFLVLSLLISGILTLTFAFILNFYQIPTAVILPTSAPIFIGILTIGYMVQTEK